MSIILNGTSGVTYPDGTTQAGGVSSPATVAQGGTGLTTATTAYGILAAGTTATGAFQNAGVGTSGQVLMSNGAGALPSFQTISTSAFPAGTRMSFQQTSAPTGWTKDTTAAINDSIIRLVTSTASSGGSTAFSTWNAQTTSGATTLSTSQIPSHSHTVDAIQNTSVGFSSDNQSIGAGTVSTSSTGGGGSHTHSLTQSLKYYDFIIASKD